MDTLSILYLTLLVVTFLFGWLLGEKLTRRYLRRQGEADYMTGYNDGLNDAYLKRQPKARP